jgi:hypothetical protein
MSRPGSAQLSSDTSPPSGYRLDSPPRPAGATGGAPLRKAPSTGEPPWVKVIATTVRLWVRRRVLRVPDGAKIEGARRTALMALAAVVIVAVVAAAVGVVLAMTGAPASHRAAHSGVTRPAITRAQQRARKQAQAAAARAVAANTTAAAIWIAAEVGQNAVIGCDPATCAAIQQAGYGNSGHVVLQPGMLLPGPGALIVATPAVSAQYKAQLTATAPEIIAAFGAGPQAVQVRVVTPGGQAGYSQVVGSAIAARRTAALQLIANHNVHVYPAPRLALTSGLVDPRLLAVLQLLASHNSVDIYSFADKGPAADSSAPYREAEIIGLISRRQVAAVTTQLQGMPNNARPAMAVVRAPGGNYALTLRFKAPSPS